MKRGTPIFIVTSSRPRVGKTLLARAAVEYFCAQNRLVQAFDVNPDELTLLATLPAYTAAASIRDTRGEMALFDRLVLMDDVPKVVDLGHSQFEHFFTVVRQINFIVEARRRAIVPIVLFVADPDDRARQGYAMLRERFDDVVPVRNEHGPRVALFAEKFPPAREGGAPLIMPALSPVVRSVVDRPQFSLLAYVVRTSDPTTELFGWIRRVFVSLSEVESRILRGDPTPRLQRSA